MNEREIAIKSVLNAIEKVSKCIETCKETRKEPEAYSVYTVMEIFYDEQLIKTGANVTGMSVTDMNVYGDFEIAKHDFKSAVDSSKKYFSDKYDGETIVNHNNDETWFKITNTDKNCTEWHYHKFEYMDIV